MILVDSNVLIDIINPDPIWSTWSMNQIASRALDRVLAVNQIVIAEVAPRFGSLAVFEAELASLGISLVEFGADTAFAAGTAFQRYRQNRGKTSPTLPLPDFFIGGHASVAQASILTRDARFYRSYFPQVELITPDQDDND